MIALVALSIPLASRPQPSLRVYRIGFLVPRSSANFGGRVDAFRAGLRELGYVEGTNLTIDWRFADGNYDRLPALADQLIQAKIVTRSGSSRCGAAYPRCCRTVRWQKRAD